MALYVYNTLTQKKELFEPLNPPKVNMYVCGVTVYDFAHIGHARAYVAFDVIYRYLRYLDYDVVYTRNFTDIDDKIIKRSNEAGIPTRELTEKFIVAYHEDMHALNLLSPNIEPRCTDYIEPMIEFISDLIEKGYAYPTANGDVYYRVRNFKGYGKLSKKNIDDLEAGARVEVADIKEHPLDFALWKGSKPGEPEWKSPWGMGRPGWHIECSVMSSKNLGETIDIHGGGKDLIFPHHENEIAQSEARTGKPFARYWLHNGFINVPAEDGSADKMSKSLGNFFTIRDVLAAFHPQSLKYLFLSVHYRNDLLFDEERLERAEERMAYFYETLARADEFVAANSAEGGNILEPALVESIEKDFIDAMDDDFNTPRAIGQLSDVFKKMNDMLAVTKGVNRADLAATLKAIREKLDAVVQVLGVFDEDPATFNEERKLRQLRFLDITPDEIKAKISERLEARANKDWTRSDAIRDELVARGIMLKDSKSGTSWDVIPKK